MYNGIKRRAACKVTSAPRSNQIISERLDRNTEFTEVRFCPSQRGEQETNLDCCGCWHRKVSFVRANSGEGRPIWKLRIHMTGVGCDSCGCHRAGEK